MIEIKIIINIYFGTLIGHLTKLLDLKSLNSLITISKTIYDHYPHICLSPVPHLV